MLELRRLRVVTGSGVQRATVAHVRTYRVDAFSVTHARAFVQPLSLALRCDEFDLAAQLLIDEKLLVLAALINVLFAEAAFEPIRTKTVDFELDFFCSALVMVSGLHFDLFAYGVVLARVVRLAARLAVLLQL